jgi:hypothetical protein
MATEAVNALRNFVRNVIACVAVFPLLAAAECSPSQAVVGDWYFPGSDAPPMTLRVIEDGSLEFAGGFLYFNPGTWRYNASACELTLQIPAMTKMHLRTMESHVGRNGVVSVNRKLKELTFSVSAPKPQLNFMGWYFFKLPESSDLLPSNQPLHPTTSGGLTAAVVAGERRR